MMKAILICSFALLTVIPIYAQDTLHTDINAKARSVILNMKRELQLSTGQEKNIYSILEIYFSTIEQIKAGTVSQNKNIIYNQCIEELQKILTEEQYGEFLTLRDKKREQKGKFKKEHPKYKFSEEDEELDF